MKIIIHEFSILLILLVTLFALLFEDIARAARLEGTETAALPVSYNYTQGE